MTAMGPRPREDLHRPSRAPESEGLFDTAAPRLQVARPEIRRPRACYPSGAVHTNRRIVIRTKGDWSEDTLRPLVLYFSKLNGDTNGKVPETVFSFRR